ncbi:MAG: thiamine pyrophosphate-dependent enzyme [Cyanobacteria bacterium P01_G01_bin.39]
MQPQETFFSHSDGDNQVDTNQNREVSNVAKSDIVEPMISPQSKQCFERYQTIAANAVKERLIAEHESSTQDTTTVSQTIVKMLETLGVTYAFGVSGGAIAPMWHTLQHSALKVRHFRHEAGAAFAATEAYFASDRPVVVFTTTAPGITNALTGLYAARWEGAKVIFISAATSAPQRGKGACQETTIDTMAHSGLFTSGELFHYATIIESAEQIPEVARRINSGLARPNGFVAHLSIPTDIQSSPVEKPLVVSNITQSLPTASATTVAQCAELLSQGSFAIWVGFGARKAAKVIRELAQNTGCAVMCSPRGKGIFPEDHPQFIGVTGFAGHESVLQYMQEQRPQHILVLGTQLGEPTSFWNPQMILTQGFIQVDLDPEVIGTAYPEVNTLGVQSDIGEFVSALIKHFPRDQQHANKVELPRPQKTIVNPDQISPVRPQVLMNQIQRIIVEGTDATIMTEAGNSFAWTINQLRFSQSNRFRVSTGFGSMGHFTVGVVGAASVGNNKAVAIVGDGSMLMNNEISTAVRYQIPAVWIVLNDGHYNMCKQGMSLLGFQEIDTEIPQVDFVKIAQGMGADGIRVAQESDIQSALEIAMASNKPFVIDVIIDATQAAPIGHRIMSLRSQSTDS